MTNAGRLPDLLRAKVVLKHSSLTEAQKVETPKTFPEAGDLDEHDELLSGECLDAEDWPDTDELENFHLIEQNDVGYDSAEEGQHLVLAW